MNFAICRCKKKTPCNPCGEVVEGDILVDGATANNSSTINNSLVGTVGFDVEILEFLDQNDKPQKVLIAYDSYCSHSQIDLSLAKCLGLSLEPLGNITIQCFAGKVKQDTFKTKARIKTKKGISELECLVSKCKQQLALFKYDIPSEWARKYNIKRVTSSPHGTNLMIIGKDNCHLFPEVLCTEVGLQLSKSKLSGLPIVSGRAMSKEDPLLSQNASVITHACVMNKSVSMNIDIILMSDRISELPLKICLKCKNCISCKSESRET